MNPHVDDPSCLALVVGLIEPGARVRLIRSNDQTTDGPGPIARGFVVPGSGSSDRLTERS